MPKAAKGVLIQADPSIKAIIMKIDADESHAYVIDELDDQTLVIKEMMLPKLKAVLEEKLKDTQAPVFSDNED